MIIQKNIPISFEMSEFESKLRATAADPPIGLELFPPGTMFKVFNGKKVVIYQTIYRGSILREVTFLGYWMGELSDEPTPYFFKSVQDIDKAVREKKIVPL